MKRLLLAVVILSLLVMPAAAQDFMKGLQAAERGDYAAALQEWRPLAGQGNTDAQLMLGLLYERGWGVSQDYAEAVSWYRRAAEQGFAPAQAEIGSAYADGQGVPQDYAKAAKWYREAAQQDFAPAQAYLGSMYVLGRGVPQDYVQAYKWLNLAAAHGNDRAVEMRDRLAARMTAAQIAEAQKLAREWSRRNRE